jgi:HD-like signal output (HDOD) protein
VLLRLVHWIVLSERVESIDKLGLPENHAALVFLSRAVQAVTTVSKQVPSLEYLLELNAHDLRERLKRPNTRDRIKLLLLPSAYPHLDEDFVLLRQIGIHRKADISVFLMVDQVQEIPQGHRDKLEKLGVDIIGRDELEGDALRRLIEEHIVIKPQQAQMQELLPAQEIHRRIMEGLENVTSLPVLPQVYQKIIALSKNPQSEIQDWIKAIKLDPSSCAIILKRAHASVYGFHEELVEVERAIILLGKRIVRNLIATESVRRAFNAVQEEGFSLEALWLHNLAVGHTAHILAFPLSQAAWGPEQKMEFDSFHFDQQAKNVLKKINLAKRLNLHPVRENPFMGGLVHDIGKAAMIQFCPEVYPLVIEHMENHHWTLPMATAERQATGGLTHPVIGEILGQQWELGERLCGAIHFHHQPDINDTFSFLIGIADFLAQAFFPFPQEAEYPIAAALENGDLEPVADFLPEGFFEQPLLSAKELIALAKVVEPAVVEFTQDMRASYQ